MCADVTKPASPHQSDLHMPSFICAWPKGLGAPPLNSQHLNLGIHLGLQLGLCSLQEG